MLLRFATSESEERRGEEVLLLLTTPIGAVVDDHNVCVGLFYLAWLPLSQGNTS